MTRGTGHLLRALSRLYRKILMRTMRRWAVTALGLVLTAAAPGPPTGTVVEYTGPPNASAAVAIGGGRFLVADDEDKPATFLRAYRTGHPEDPPALIPLSNAALKLDPGE